MKRLDAANDNDAGKQIARTRQIWQPRLGRDLTDEEGYRPELGQLDRDGIEIEDRIYNTKDFDRNIVLDDRTVLTAKKITEFLKESGDRFQKTIVFCVDEEHAARMRQALVNANADLVAENPRYVMRITGSDKEGQEQLGNFIDPESKYPVLVTTSRLLSTGVDAQTCRLIVLDRAVGSMTEFKQIVGRGTRVHEEPQRNRRHPPPPARGPPGRSLGAGRGA
jgi:type I restriction enzyme R subunit